jgi:hypothetical protein
MIQAHVSGPLFLRRNVDDLVAVGARRVQRFQSISKSRPQQIQYQLLGAHRIS